MNPCYMLLAVAASLPAAMAIVNGIDTPKGLPFVGALLKGTVETEMQQECGGSLITEYGGLWLLTAKHCVRDPVTMKPLGDGVTFEVGVNRISVGGPLCAANAQETCKNLAPQGADEHLDNPCAENIPVTRSSIFVHETADIALLKLDKLPTKCNWDAKAANVKIATVGEYNACKNNPRIGGDKAGATGCELNLAGWGSTLTSLTETLYTPGMRSAQTRVVPCPKFSDKLGLKLLDSTTICTDKASRKTDSGGGYYQLINGVPTVLAIATVATPTDGSESIDITMDVAQHRDWIRKTCVAHEFDGKLRETAFGPSAEDKDHLIKEQSSEESDGGVGVILSIVFLAVTVVAFVSLFAYLQYLEGKK